MGRTDAKAMPAQARVPGAEVFAYALHGNCYLNVTNRCNLRCRFCPRIEGHWVVKGYNLRLSREPSAAELLDAVGDPSRYREVVFCGLGEPTVRLRVVLEVGRALRARGARVRLNTNGLANLEHGRDVTRELAEAVDAVSVSLNASDPKTYERECRPLQGGASEAMLEFAARARGRITEVTLTAVDGVPGVDIEACEAIAARLGLPFRRRTLGDVG
jgi:TatD DNase family protein